MACRIPSAKSISRRLLDFEVMTVLIVSSMCDCVNYVDDTLILNGVESQIPRQGWGILVLEKFFIDCPWWK
jgi:hypothetical protein